MEFTLIYIASQIFIIIHYLLVAAAYFFKERKTILSTGFLMMLFAGLSYICLSAWTGLAMCGVVLVRNLVFLIQEKKGKSDEITKNDIIFLIILYIIAGIFAVWCKRLNQEPINYGTSPQVI